MAIQYKVVELKGRPDPRSSGETPEVTAEDIETALNQQGRDHWDLFTMLERFTETSPKRHGCGIRAPPPRDGRVRPAAARVGDSSSDAVPDKPKSLLYRKKTLLCSWKA
jgi:hypothetical protein